MARTIRSLFLLVLASALIAPLLAAAQSPPPDAAAAPPAAPLPQDKLDALLAPIAHYPDQLLGQVLMASTYPLEVVEAARWGVSGVMSFICNQDGVVFQKNLGAIR